MAKKAIKEQELNEEVLNQEELEETGEEIVDADIDDDIPEDEDEDQEDEQPGKFKRFRRAIWKWSKRIAPIVGGYAAGIATPIVAKKWRTGKVDSMTDIQPIVPDITTTTVDLGNGDSAEVTNF